MSEQVIVNSEQVPDEAEGFSEKEKAANRPGTEKRDWVGEAVQCFIKDAQNLDPTDPVKAVETYFQKNAAAELKARCKAEGKDARGCWRFIEAVARKALGNRSGHIDPSAIYAIVMHWFEDVPADWNKEKTAKARPKASTPKKPQAENSKAAKPKKPAETPAEIRKEKAKAKAARPKKKPRAQQGFFFEMLETPAVGGEGRGDESPRAEQESEVKE